MASDDYRIRTISHKTCYKTSYVTVKENLVSLGRGRVKTLTTIRLPDSVSILPIDENGYVYLIKEFKYAARRWSIVVPSGSVEKNETTLVAAKRELREETGIIGRHWQAVGTIHPVMATAYYQARLYLARHISWTECAREPTERIRIFRTTLRKAVRMVHNGQITHAQSCVLILMSVHQKFTGGFLNSHSAPRRSSLKTRR